MDVTCKNAFFKMSHSFEPCNLHLPLLPLSDLITKQQMML